MIRGSKVKLEAGGARKMQMDTAIHNRFDVEVMGPDGEVKQRVTAYNIILNALWTALLGNNGGNWSWFTHIAYGSGTGTLAASRTSLFTPIGAKAVLAELGIDYSHHAEGYVSYRKTIQIAAGEIAGQTLREVGIATGTASTNLVTHALLKDMNGNTVSIVVGDLDVINIYATVYVHFNPAGYEGGNVYFEDRQDRYTLLAHIAGCGHRVSDSYADTSLARAMQYLVPYCGDLLGPVASNKLGSFSTNVAAKTISARWSLAAGIAYRVGVNDLNPGYGGGWRSARIYFSYRNQLYYYPSGVVMKFPNDAKPYCTLTDEAIGTGDGSILDFSLDFGFVKDDGSAVIKVDGAVVPTTNYTIDHGRTAATSVGMFLTHVSGETPGAWAEGLALNGGNKEVVESPFYIQLGITSIEGHRLKIEVSDDLVSWTKILDMNWANAIGDVPAQYQKKRYWRASEATGGSGGYITSVHADPNCLLHFTAGNAPASGAAVTGAYRTETICKDINHVVDLELAITLNEYTG